MIKNIMSNGIYWVITSFLLTTIAYFIQTFKSDEDFSPYYALSLLLLFVCLLTTIVLDSVMLTTRKLIYNSKIQMLLPLTLFLVILTGINIFEISVLISFVHCIYRMSIYRNIETLSLELKYNDIIKILNLTNEFIAVKGEFKNYTTYIRGKDISFEGDSSLFFKNKRVKFEVVRYLQVEFSKPFISFDDNELKVAEMYSIQ